MDSVKSNLQGFWVDEKVISKANHELLWLEFNDKYTAYWEIIPFNKEIEESQTLPFNSCATVASLIKIDSNVSIELTGFLYKDTLKIEKLTKTRLHVNGIKYRRHKGYEFLK